MFRSQRCGGREWETNCSSIEVVNNDIALARSLRHLASGTVDPCCGALAATRTVSVGVDG